jgi:ABC-2 type transport system permease protein
MIGVSDSSPWLGLCVATLAASAVLLLCWYWFKIGFRLKA